MFKVDEDNCIVAPNLSFNINGIGNLIENSEIIVIGKYKQSIGYKQFGPLYMNENIDALNKAIDNLKSEISDMDREYIYSESSNIVIELWTYRNDDSRIQGCIYDKTDEDYILERVESATYNYDLRFAEEIEDD